MRGRTLLDQDVPDAGGRFVTTSWSRVLQAASDDDGSKPALADLCRTYWYPLYAYLRRQGVTPTDAEDAVQAFFARLLEDGILRHVDPERGRFRGFLLAALRQFMAGRRVYESAAKRRPPGGLVPIELSEGELRYSKELTHRITPDLLYDYTWAMALLKRAMDLLRAENQAKAPAGRFEAFQGLLTGQSARTAREIGEELGMTEGAVRVALFRLKQRYGEILRQEVASTLGEGGDVEEEIRALMAAVQMDRRS
ncbi:MAG: hypothetical protein U0835_14565 [Isosphaeraceae bacterium]